MKTNPIILGIDTSCDETSAGITFGNKIFSNVISSQVKLHEVWGGVVPDIARRAHKEKIDFVIARALTQASQTRSLREKYRGLALKIEDIDAVAVTYGPGLAIALEVGINKAIDIAKQYNKPLIAINHLEGHLLSPLAKNSLGTKGLDLKKEDFPILGVIISGKHTDLVLVESIGKYRVVGETLDDAIGEAYDKVGRMLDLGYPAGPVLTEMAKKGDPKKYPLPIPLHNRADTLNFSFSGLKTAVYYLIKNELGELSKQDVCNVAASFEFSAISHLKEKIAIAIERHQPQKVLVGGGVGSSKAVRVGIRKISRDFGLEAHFPYGKKLYMDNGAMIAHAGFYRYLKGEFVESVNTIDREPRLSL